MPMRLSSRSSGLVTGRPVTRARLDSRRRTDLPRRRHTRSASLRNAAAVIRSGSLGTSDQPAMNPAATTRSPNDGGLLCGGVEDRDGLSLIALPIGVRAGPRGHDGLTVDVHHALD